MAFRMRVVGKYEVRFGAVQKKIREYPVQIFPCAQLTLLLFMTRFGVGVKVKRILKRIRILVAIRQWPQVPSLPYDILLVG